MIGGYWGKLLNIDLSNDKISFIKVSDDLCMKFIGGSGLGAKYLHELTNGFTDPLSKDNVLIFLTGPFTGTKIPNSGRHSAIFKSPLTGIWGEGNIGGNWGNELKKAGFDGVIIRGKAKNPKYIYINNQTVEIRDAQHLWQKDTFEVDQLLKKEVDNNAVITCIGIAGEKLVPLACIKTDGRISRSLGRGGGGAVMGSKKLKAVVVKGNYELKVFKPESLKKFIRQLASSIVEKSEAIRQYGTSGGIETYERMLDFPLKNWYQERWPEGAKKINGIRMAESILVGRYFCKHCVIGCGRKIEITKGLYKGLKGAGPEYETIGTLGGLCLIDDLEAIAKGNELCNRFGLDTISTGSVIAFAMEAYEKGLITNKDTDGLKLNWGNARSMLSLIKKIAYREDNIGKLLCQGVRNASREVGSLAQEFAIHSKGLELPAHDPRAFNGVALSYATSNRGACHLQGFTHIFENENGITTPMPEIGIEETHPRYQVDGKGEFTAKLQNLMCIFDSIGLCKFVIPSGVSLKQIAEMFFLVTGVDLNCDDLMKIGDRIYNLKRLYNVRCGISRKDDTLPSRILTHRRGPNLPHLGKMLNDYYHYRNWSEDGIPLKSTLEILDLEKEAIYLNEGNKKI